MKLRSCCQIVAVSMMIGCGGTYDSYVTGVVTLDSTPLTRGTVSFKPLSSGPTAYGFIESNGQFSMKTGSEAGLPPGEYSVTVVANEPSIVNPDGGPPTPGTPITPPWYRSSSTSGLERTIEAGSNEVNFDLSTEPPADWNPEPKKKRRKRR